MTFPLGVCVIGLLLLLVPIRRSCDDREKNENETNTSRISAIAEDRDTTAQWHATGGEITGQATPSSGSALTRPSPDSRALRTPQGALAAVTRTLPRDILSFTGREADLALVIRPLTNAAGERPVGGIYSIDGMAGVGKTAFAVHVAHRLAPNFPDGQLFVRLHAHTAGQPPTDPSDVLGTLLVDDGIAAQHIPDDFDARINLWRNRMADRRRACAEGREGGGRQLGAAAVPISTVWRPIRNFRRRDMRRWTASRSCRSTA